MYTEMGKSPEAEGANYSNRDLKGNERQKNGQGDCPIN
jgi:hypothetical protein